MEDKKKRVAAISAVMSYVRKEEEEQSQAAPPPPEIFRPANLWGISGRQAMMQTRNLMQLKAFCGWRVR